MCRRSKQKTQTGLKPEIKNVMLQDIKRCEEAIKNPSLTNALYFELIAKYVMIDKDFQKGMPNFVKTLNSNYLTEITLIKAKLETYIILDEIPITYNENAAQNANITIQTEKFSNKGNIGVGNSQQKSTEVNLSIKEEKQSGFFAWLKKLFRR